MTTLTSEQWRSVLGFVGYEVSNLGRLRYMLRWNKPKILRAFKHTRGYLKYCLAINGKMKTMLAHRIVGIAFVQNPENLPQINHKNSIKDDNRIENLEWCTGKSNRAHAMQNNRYLAGEDHPNAKYSNEQICRARKLIAQGYSRKEVRKLFGLSRYYLNDILNIRRNRRRQYAAAPAAGVEKP